MAYIYIYISDLGGERPISRTVHLRNLSFLSFFDNMEGKRRAFVQLDKYKTNKFNNFEKDKNTR